MKFIYAKSKNCMALFFCLFLSSVAFPASALESSSGQAELDRMIASGELVPIPIELPEGVDGPAFVHRVVKPIAHLPEGLATRMLYSIPAGMKQPVGGGSDDCLYFDDGALPMPTQSHIAIWGEAHMRAISECVKLYVEINTTIADHFGTQDELREALKKLAPLYVQTQP